MNGLSLCAGGGALDLAVKIAFPAFETIAAVENNPEAARRFRLRYPEAKLFSDVVGFDARPLHSIVDCVIAGWPCQPHSVAGKRLGTADERWIWDDIARILDETGAPLFFGENVSGLLRDATGKTQEDGELDYDTDGSMGGMGTVLRDLAQMGFLSFWGSLRAAQVGAGHGRPRVFILAYRHGYGTEDAHDERQRRPPIHNCGPGGAMADASNGQLPEQGRRTQGRNGARPTGPLLGEPAGTGLPERRDDPGLREFPAVERTGPAMVEPSWIATSSERSGRRRGIRGTGNLLEPFAPGPADPLWLDILAESPYLAPALSPVTKVLAGALSQEGCDFQAEIESGFRGLVDGMAHWLVERRPRLQIGGNGVVPLQAAAVLRKLAQIAGIEDILLADDSARDVTARVPAGAIPGVGCTTRAERF